MWNREDMNAVIEGLQRDHALLAAFLEATDKIDWRALHRRVAIGETSTSPSIWKRSRHRYPCEFVVRKLGRISSERCTTRT